jgi:hypothetical protein
MDLLLLGSQYWFLAGGVLSGVFWGRENPAQEKAA